MDEPRPDHLAPSPARRVKAVRRHFMNARLRLAFTEWSRPGAPIAILIHGSRDHGRSWDAVAQALHGAYHVIAPDLRGHGDSGWSQDGRYDFAAHLADLAALCEAVEGTPEKPVTLIAHSLGSHVALRYAGAFPDRVRQIVAIEAVGAPPPVEAHREGQPIDWRIRDWIEERQAASIAAPRWFPSVEEAVARMHARHGFLSPAQALHLTRHGLRRESGKGWRWKHDPYLSVWPFPDIPTAQVEALWRRIACPTLLIYGERSWPSSVPARLLDAIPHAEVLRLAESGHWPQHDALEACLAGIAAFLQPSPRA